jgi:hypothetical protein
MNKSLKGKIVEVMESFPIQLVLDSNGIIYHLGLLEETIVIRHGKSVNIDELMPEVHIMAIGKISHSDSKAMIVKKIEIID